jgi:hypothetical protein
MLFRSKRFEPREAELAAIQAPMADEPFIPGNLDIIAFYGSHVSHSDFAPLKPLLAHADVFVPELPAWTQEQVELLSRISQGDKSARNELRRGHTPSARFTGFAEAETRTLLGSNTRITVVDYAANDPRATEIFSHFDGYDLLKTVVPSWSKTLGNIVSMARREASMESHRDAVKAKSIGPRLETLIGRDPELKQKERVRVVLQEGRFHEQFFGQLVSLVEASGTSTIERVTDDREPGALEHYDRLVQAFQGNAKLSTKQQRELAMRALARSGLSLGAIPFVKEPGDYKRGRFMLPPPEVMAERFDEVTIRDFHKRVVQTKQAS